MEVRREESGDVTKGTHRNIVSPGAVDGMLKSGKRPMSFHLPIWGGENNPPQIMTSRHAPKCTGNRVRTDALTAVKDNEKAYLSRPTD